MRSIYKSLKPSVYAQILEGAQYHSSIVNRGWSSVSPSPENFWKIKLETIRFGAYSKQLFEISNKMVQLPTFMKNH